MHMLMHWNFPLLSFGEHHFGIYDLNAVRQHFADSIAVYSDSLNLLVMKKYE
ncbi:hypothetical protein J2Z70_004260 [Paenibacillus silagei]|uniref:Uncharacterized protein n=1 Tax=Paenibacillus silagei TaxID=1670801 RepID=A0ABS4NXD2_9BACL|nr:hypothetical protein [Paenibacillus silagei]